MEIGKRRLLPPRQRGIRQREKADQSSRFIPTRDGSDIHAAYQLLSEETHETFTHLLKTELFPKSACPPRTDSPARSNAGTTPLHHRPLPAVSGAGGNGERERNGERELSPASTLPPLPMHAPSTPTSGHDRPPGAGPSSSHHRAHQSQVALTSGTSRSRTTPPSSGRRNAFSPPPTGGLGLPSTPTKKRLLNFSSPGSARMAAFAGTSTGGLDDMAHEKYSLSPVGKESQRVLLSPRKVTRQISKTPFKVLDAPDLAVNSSKSGAVKQLIYHYRTISTSTSSHGLPRMFLE